MEMWFSPAMKTTVATAFLTIILILLIGPGAAGAQAGDQAGSLKAAFIYNFAKFVDWPAKALPGAGGPFLIGVLGTGTLADNLRALEGKSVKGHQIQIKNLLQPEDGKSCHLLVITNADRRQASQIITAIRGHSVLTVGDEVDNFLNIGGIINLVSVDAKIRFEINTKAAQQADLQISSQLLKLALLIKE